VARDGEPGVRVSGLAPASRVPLLDLGLTEEERASARPADVVTVLWNPKGRANKEVRRKADGAVEKDGAPNCGRYVAVAYLVPSVRAMAELVRQVSDRADVCLCLGRFVGEPARVPRKLGRGEPFEVLSRRRMAKAKGLAEDAPDDALLGWHRQEDRGRGAARRTPSAGSRPT
jgi:hypothetical protein